MAQGTYDTKGGQRKNSIYLTKGLIIFQKRRKAPPFVMFAFFSYSRGDPVRFWAGFNRSPLGRGIPPPWLWPPLLSYPCGHYFMPGEITQKYDLPAPSRPQSIKFPTVKSTFCRHQPSNSLTICGPSLGRRNRESSIIVTLYSALYACVIHRRLRRRVVIFRSGVVPCNPQQALYSQTP